MECCFVSPFFFAVDGCMERNWMTSRRMDVGHERQPKTSQLSLTEQKGSTWKAFWFDFYGYCVTRLCHFPLFFWKLLYGTRDICQDETCEMLFMSLESLKTFFPAPFPSLPSARQHNQLRTWSIINTLNVCLNITAANRNCVFHLYRPRDWLLMFRQKDKCLFEVHAGSNCLVGCVCGAANVSTVALKEAD